MTKVRSAAQFVARHRIVSALLVFALLASVGFGVYGVTARAPGESFGGTIAPGSHVWWDVDDPYGNFCNQCHADIATEIAQTLSAGTHPAGVTQCLVCHAASWDAGHVASVSKCADCHSDEATDLLNDGHASFYDDLGESEADASWSCKACHTQVSVNMTTVPMGPLELVHD